MCEKYDSTFLSTSGLNWTKLHPARTEFSKHQFLPVLNYLFSTSDNSDIEDSSFQEGTVFLRKSRDNSPNVKAKFSLFL